MVINRMGGVRGDLTVAELHGKLSRSGSNVHDRLEDLLTADVFGPLRYSGGPAGVFLR